MAASDFTKIEYVLHESNTRICLKGFFSEVTIVCSFVSLNVTQKEIKTLQN